ncbi:MAG: hypothetical protein LC739_10175 [Actinobacteria bacterium]|nr:hypothetical protein [Actinomycetota bacterium]
MPYRPDGYHLAYHLTAPAEVTISGTLNGQALEPLSLGLIEAGFYDHLLGEVFADLAPGVLKVRISAASPHGDYETGVVLVPERR